MKKYIIIIAINMVSVRFYGMESGEERKLLQEEQKMERRQAREKLSDDYKNRLHEQDTMEEELQKLAQELKELKEQNVTQEQKARALEIVKKHKSKADELKKKKAELASMAKYRYQE
jgi:hypothetical protein